MIATGRRTVGWALLLPLILSVAATGGADGLTLAVCAPGYPGSTAEAQPAMDALAAAIAAAAGWEPGAVSAVYFELEDDGVAGIGRPETAFALVTLPFFLEHRHELDLRPELLAVPAGRLAAEPWTLVAGRGAVETPADLAGWTLVSLAGHSARFVRGPALGDWGPLPDSLTITFSGAVLSSLRKAARGDRVAVLLDAEQAAALDRLPFAADLEVVHRSAPLPVSVLCAVGDRPGPNRAATFTKALQSLDERTDAEEALAGVRLDRFEPVDAAALDRAQTAFPGAAE